jgi:hypothetical protein
MERAWCPQKLRVFPGGAHGSDDGRRCWPGEADMTGAIRSARVQACCLVLLMTTLLALATAPPADAATATALARYPYLTDATQTSMTINWATDTSGSSGSVVWGPAGNCTANTTAATRTSMTVISKAEYQWKAVVPVTPDGSYCYRVKLGSVDLLGTDATPQFTAQVRAGSATPYSFAVFGDWGQAYAGGVNADQTNVLKQIATSGSRFAVMTGDTAYPGGGQKEYGDLRQLGTDQSTVFGPTFWGVPGRSIPVFNVTGNHGFTNGAVQVVNWPEERTAAASGGKYQMEAYPSINGSTAKSYPSMWYAFDAGPARFYVLTASWADGNIGTGSVYKNDRDAHWTPNSAEYKWLQSDLAAHPNALKFAFWHYPLYADSGGQPSDTFLQGGPGTLQGLLDANKVAVAFNGHAHGYERNKPDSAGMVTYVLGNGGAALGSVSGCSSYDLYAIGAKGSHCGAAPSGLSNDHVFGFAKVTVNGRTVTVTPTDEMGRTFDVQTYTFPGGVTDNVPPTPLTTLSATVVSTSRIDLSWNGATDNVGVTGYQIYRAVGTGAPVKLADVTGASYSDTTASPSTSYTYSVYALDAAGNRSSAKSATATTPGADDVTPPSQPGTLQGAATSSSVVNLTWTASTDNVRVAGYKVYRNGTLISQPIVPGDPNPPTAYTDDTATAGTTYTYAVSAVDAANNESTKATTTVTTPGGVTGTFTFAPTDDAYVNSSAATTNYGTASRLTVDNSPQTNTLLKFSVAGLPTGCRVTAARLRLTVGSTTDDKSPYGGDLYGVADTAWTQSTVTWSNQPAAAAGTTSGVATAVALDTAYDWNATSLVTGNGVVSMALKSTSSDGARYYSTEGGTATQDPTLIVSCG